MFQCVFGWLACSREMWLKGIVFNTLTSHSNMAKVWLFSKKVLEEASRRLFATLAVVV
jgi:hypothetical protein